MARKKHTDQPLAGSDTVSRKPNVPPPPRGDRGEPAAHPPENPSAPVPASAAADASRPPGTFAERVKQRRQQGLCVHCGRPAFIHLRGPRQGQPSDLCPAHSEARRVARRARVSARRGTPVQPRTPNNRHGATRAELRAQGRCVTCGQPAHRFTTGWRQGSFSQYCPAHLAAEHQIRQQRRADGLCAWCDQPAARFTVGPRTGQTMFYCLKHLIYLRENDRRRNGATRRKDSPSYQAQRAAGQETPEFPPPASRGYTKSARTKARCEQGLCVKCGQPALLRQWGPRRGQPTRLCPEHSRQILARERAKKPPHIERFTHIERYDQAPNQPLLEKLPSKYELRLRQHLCVSCGQPALLFTTGKAQGTYSNFCLPHLIAQREHFRLKAGTIRRSSSPSYRAALAAGIADPEHQLPPKTSKPKNQIQRERRKQGLCARCGQPALVHLTGQRKGQPATLCTEHLIARREYVRKLLGCIGRTPSLSYAADPSIPAPVNWRQGRTKEQLREQCLCLRCGQPTALSQASRTSGKHYLLCEKHRQEAHEKLKIWKAECHLSKPDPDGQNNPTSTTEAALAAAPGVPHPDAPPDSHRAKGLCWICKRPADFRKKGPHKGQFYIHCQEHRAKNRKRKSQAKDKPSAA